MAGRKGEADQDMRHGSESSSTGSWNSYETVRQDQAPSGPRATSMHAQTRQNARPVPTSRKSSSVLPDRTSSKYLFASEEPSPKEMRHSGGSGQHRKALAVLGAGDQNGPAPAITEKFPSPHPGNIRHNHEPLASSSSITPGEMPGSFLDDDEDEPSSSLQPPSGRPAFGNNPGMSYEEDRRRPSVASANTEGSQSSRTSQRGRFQKKLQGFFGDDYNRSDPQLDLQRTSSKPPSVSSRNQSKVRDREGSVHSTRPMERSMSSDHSRPLTPVPSSDVAPWMYQKYNDIPNYGDAPVHEDPTEPDSQRYPSVSEKSGSAKGSRRLHFPRHRHSRSREDKQAPNELGVPHVASERDVNQATRSRDGFRSPATAMSSTTTLGGRSASPTPSAQSASQQEAQGQRSPGGPPAKRSLLDKLKRPHHHRPHIGALKSLPSSTRSLQEPSKGAKSSKREASPRRSRNGSFDGPVPGKGFENVEYERKKGPSKLRHHRFPFGHDSATNKANEKARRGGFEEDRVWTLDTDLSNLDDIVTEPRPLSPTDSGGIYTGAPLPEHKERELRHPLDASLSGDWRAPESWAVKKVGDEVVGRLPELPDEGYDLAIEDKGPYCIRIFRIDSTFATLSLALNTTVTDVLETLGRKSFLQEDLNNYEIVLRKNDLSRTLDHGERPVLMQKRMLQQAGYHESDRIADIGREDNSYLCRFTFLPTKLSGYSSLDVDPGFPKNHKFNHVDLQGRSLVTIPIMLYKKSGEIISLNLSRNLALDVPKDFIQSCVNLREIKYTGNEAWRLPGSFSLAAKLTFLDISNNLLEQLEHAELHRLKGLVSLKMANNKLSSLPAYFGEFNQLRSLNISSNYFTELPDFLHNLKSLVDLDISFNRITELPNIGRLKTLERLWVTNNALHGPLGETFTNLTNLKEIDARFNGITNIDSVCDLPRLEQLLIGHNGVTNFSGTFPRLRQLVLDHCPVTEFDLPVPVPTLISVNIASAKLVQFKDTLFGNMPSLTKLNLNKNHFVSLSPHLGLLRKLEHFSIAKNPLSALPNTIGCLTELKHLNLRECNLNRLPPEIWFCSKLENLNVSSNVLDSFPRAASVPPSLPTEPLTNGTPVSTPGLSTSPSFEELGKLEDFDARRPSHASSSMFSLGSSPGSHRKGSAASLPGPGGRKASVASRATDTSSSSRKDSTFSQRLTNTFAGSLRHLSLADNRLDDEIFRQLAMLTELRTLNLSYNELTEFPQGLLKRWHYLAELYLSGNELTSLPSDDLEESSNLKVLHINVNKFQVLPAELCKVNRLAILDVGSNSLKYNVSNWPYDWNWNWNHNLKYLNFSGNKRFEIRPTTSYTSPANTFNGTDLTNFNSLDHLRVLGLMDVTLTTPTIPDQTEDRRVRTSASLSGTITYGMADTLGITEHLSMIDMVVPGFRGDQMETLIGLFDGQASSEGGSKVAKYLHENFTPTFNKELKRIRPNGAESPEDALRRTFLALNKDMATATLKTIDERDHHRRDPPTGGANQLTREDGHSGGVATILYLQNMDLFCANIGDAQAVLVQTNGQFKYLTRNHDPAESEERDRIREAGGFVSRNGKLNDKLSVSRAFGYYNMMPAVIAAPNCTRVSLTAQDEMIILASGELWNYVTADVVVDVARAEREDLMIASQKLRDLAIAYGASNKIMVMIAGVTDLKRKERNKIRSTSLSMGPTGDDIFPTTKRVKRPKDAPSDSRLARLDRVEPPTGELAIIFTDIKRSTSLWETYPVAMRSAIQIHNDLFRRQLSAFGGYEVKTEGDAFMVSFSTASAALLWCFTCQTLLLDAPWPTEILETPPGREQYDNEGNLIYRGLSVRMGVHWGTPVCEKDPITGRMDYFGPMVNRASRISAVADGGQIFVSSDFISEIQRNLEVFADYERSSSTGSEDTFIEDFFNRNIRNELYQLSTQGFEVKDLGERKLKGLENPEFVYLMYPHALSGRLLAPHDMSDHADTLPIKLGKDARLNIEADLVWRLWRVSLRLEAFCSALENPGAKMLKEPDTGVLNSIINRGGDLTDAAVLALVEHQVTRIELCASNLAIRHMMRPFRHGDQIQDHAIPMADILKELQVQLAEFRALKEQISLDSSGAVSRVGGDERTPKMTPKALPAIISSLDESPMRSMYDENGLLV